MAYCPFCGQLWLVRTGQLIRHAVLGRSHNDVIEPPDIPCPDCETRYGG